MATIRTNGIDTYYERPVDQYHRYWEPQVETLKDDYEVVTYDVRGHGKTGGSSVPAYSMDLYAMDLRALVEGLELDRPAVVGHSLGGMFALPYAVDYPDAIGALVLADAQVDPTTTLTQRLVQEVFMPAHLAAIRLVGRERADAAAKWVNDRLFDVDDDEEDGELEAYAEETTEMIDDEEMRKIIRSIRTFEAVEFSAIDVPTLGIYGEDDPEMMHFNAVRLRREVPDAEVEFVPDAEHGLNWDNPEAFDAALLEFLDRTIGDRESTGDGEDRGAGENGEDRDSTEDTEDRGAGENGEDRDSTEDTEDRGSA